ncbi:MAG: cysteine desulfurase family protein [Patescibacteria group bacterium]
MIKKEPISKRIYLDYAATTPVDTEVFNAMKPFFGEGLIFGNPNSLHSFGRESLKYIDEARAKIAQSIGADFNEIIFTGSATEANSLALRGVLKNYHHQSNKITSRPKIIISAIEHESVYETAKDLEKEGVETVIIPVNKNGIIDVKKIEKELDERTILISIMYANNEIGTIQPIFEISKIIENWKSKTGNYETTHPLFHTDAVQAFQFLDCNVKKLGVDLMTFSAHKIYGPKGVGVLYVKKNKTYPLSSIITGGGQEFGLRSGTQNIAGIVGCAKACELADKNRNKETKRIAKLREELWTSIKKVYPKAETNGSLENTLPNILNVYFPDISSELFLIKLDMEGIAVSSGSACHARSQEPSRIIQDIWGETRARESIRFSLGKYTTKEEIEYVGGVLKRVLENIK